MLSILMTSQVLFMPVADYLLYGTLPSLNHFHYLGFALTISCILALFLVKHISVVRKERAEKQKQSQKQIRLGHPEDNVKTVLESQS